MALFAYDFYTFRDQMETENSSSKRLEKSFGSTLSL